MSIGQYHVTLSEVEVCLNQSSTPLDTYLHLETAKKLLDEYNRLANLE